MNSKKPLGKLMPIVFGLLFLFYLAGCEEFTKETYEISGVEQVACNQLTDSVFYKASTSILQDIDTSLTHENMPANVTKILDSLQALGKIIEADPDQGYSVSMAAEDTTYIMLQANIKSFVVFADDAIDLNLFEESGKVVGIADSNMPLETISGCQKKVKELEVPVIKFRRAFNVSGNRILVQMMKTEQTKSSKFKLTAK